MISNAHFHRHVTLSVCAASDSAALISNLLRDESCSRNSTNHVVEIVIDLPQKASKQEFYVDGKGLIADSQVLPSMPVVNIKYL